MASTWSFEDIFSYIKMSNDIVTYLEFYRTNDTNNVIFKDSINQL